MRRTTHRRPSFALPREDRAPVRAARRSLYRYRVSVVRDAAYPCYDALSVSSPKSTARFVRSLLGDYDREVLGVLFFDVRQRPIGIHFASIGSAKRTVAEPPEILRAALAANASSFLLFHCHPSGDPTPSVNDLEVTRRMWEAGDVVGIRLVDHLIVGEGERYVSLRRKGWVQ